MKDQSLVDRFDRLRRIEGWDPEKLARAKVMVVGAGALGNEILKNLALVGVGHILVVDSDNIDTTNLTRSPLFRPGDVGHSKAVVAAEEVREIWPDARVQYVAGRIGSDVGWGVFRRMDVVMGGVDNRRARLDICRVCWKVAKPFVDAGLDKLDGSATLFYPGKSACYECTLQSREMEILDQEYDCLGVDVGSHGSAIAPTAPTTSAILAGVQTQIAIKLLHGWDPDEFGRPGRSVRYYGAKDVFDELNYLVRANCRTHELGTASRERLIELPEQTAAGTTLRQILEIARKTLGADIVLDFASGDDKYRQFVTFARCVEHPREDPIFSLLSKVSTDRRKCPRCGKPRYLSIVQSIKGDEPFLDKTLTAMGIPPLHWIPVKKQSDGTIFYFELTGDERLLFTRPSL